MDWSTIIAAGIPGALALVGLGVKWWRDRPLRDAKAAEVLTNTATGLLDRMQADLDHLREELREAEDRIVELEARLDEARSYAEKVGELRVEVQMLRSENERLHALLPHRFDPLGPSPTED